MGTPAVALEVDGLDEMGAAFQGVDLRMVPLQTGGSETGACIVSAGGCSVQRHWADVPLLAEGAVERDKVGLLFAARNDRGAVYNGHAPPAGGAVLYAPGAAHTGSGGAYENLSLTIPADLYWENLSALLQRDAEGWPGPHRLLALDPEAQRRMEGLLRAPEKVLRAGGGATDVGFQLCEASVPRICELLADGLAAPRPDALTPARRRGVFYDARDLIHASYQEPLQMVDLCRAVGVGAETLRLVFQHFVDMPPMRYLKLIRLVRCHEGLLSCDPRVDNVKTVAMRCGIRNLGRFAAAYRRMYGRLPREDLPTAHPRDGEPRDRGPLPMRQGGRLLVAGPGART